MKITPLADRVLVKAQAMETKTTSGLYSPETAQEKTQIGTVVAVGQGTEKVKMLVKPGDKILHDKYAGVSVKDNGDEYLILKMDDILAILG